LKAKNTTKKYVLILRLLVLLFSVGLLIKMVDFRLVWRHIEDIPYYIFIALVGIGMVRAWLSGLRWRLINPDVSKQLSQWQYFRFLMIAHTFNLIMPGSLGGDFVKTAMALKTVKNNRAHNLIAIVADRFIGLFSIIMLGSLAMIFATKIPDRSVFYRSFGFLIFGFSSVILVSTNKFILKLVETICSHFGRLGRFLISFLNTWRSALLFFRQNYFRVFLALLLCLPIHGIVFLTKFVVAKYMNIPLTFFDVCAIQALVWVIAAIPITISGAGVRELTVIYFLSFYGVEAEAATALSMYSYIVAVLLGFIGILFLWNGNIALPFRQTSLKAPSCEEGEEA